MRSTARRSVAATSRFGSFEKPMWLSLIWTKVKSPGAEDAAGAAGAGSPNVRDDSTPPLTLQTTPAPTHAMHLRKPRRSMPSGDGWASAARAGGLAWGSFRLSMGSLLFVWERAEVISR